MRKRSGDTLVEVALAIGIFSMVAISIVSVISGSTADAQEALEVSLTREEIDTQAEALRFIHSSYSNSKSVGEATGKYKELWDKMIDGADTNNPSTDIPSSCGELYSKEDNDGDKVLVKSGAFIINPRKLNLPLQGTNSSNIDRIIVKATEDNISAEGTDTNAIFKEATTYPHLIFNNKNSSDPSQDPKQSEDYIDDNYLESSDLYNAQGIYIVPVEGTASSNGTPKKTTYYDFFIRTCWYGVGDDKPSTISTVVRLYDPNVLNSNN